MECFPGTYEDSPELNQADPKREGGDFGRQEVALIHLRHQTLGKVPELCLYSLELEQPKQTWATLQELLCRQEPETNLLG